MTDSSELIQAVRGAQLGDQDIQSLIEVLLNKQGGGGSSISTEWNKVIPYLTKNTGKLIPCIPDKKKTGKLMPDIKIQVNSYLT